MINFIFVLISIGVTLAVVTGGAYFFNEYFMEMGLILGAPLSAIFSAVGILLTYLILKKNKIKIDFWIAVIAIVLSLFTAPFMAGTWGSKIAWQQIREPGLPLIKQYHYADPEYDFKAWFIKQTQVKVRNIEVEHITAGRLVLVNITPDWGENSSLYLVSDNAGKYTIVDQVYLDEIIRSKVKELTDENIYMIDTKNNGKVADAGAIQLVSDVSFLKGNPIRLTYILNKKECVTRLSVKLLKVEFPGTADNALSYEIVKWDGKHRL